MVGEMTMRALEYQGEAASGDGVIYENIQVRRSLTQ